MFMEPDFFTRFAAIYALIGFVLFMVFGLTAVAIFHPPFDWINNDYSAVGAITDGNVSAGFLNAGLAVAGALWIPVVIACLRQLHLGKQLRARFFASAGFIAQLAGRVAMILVGAFPTEPWHAVHVPMAITWMAAETAGVAFIMLDITLLQFRTRVQRGSKKDWMLAAIAVIVACSLSWLPVLALGLEGYAIPEFVSMLAIYAFSIAIWIKAYVHGAGFYLETRSSG